MLNDIKPSTPNLECNVCEPPMSNQPNRTRAARAALARTHGTKARPVASSPTNQPQSPDKLNARNTIGKLERQP